MTRQLLMAPQAFRNMPMFKKLDLYFNDFSLIPLMVQQNYLKPQPLIAQEVSGGDSRRMQWEHMVLVTDSGHEVLTLSAAERRASGAA